MVPRRGAQPSRPRNPAHWAELPYSCVASGDVHRNHGGLVTIVELEFVATTRGENLS